VLGKGRGRWIPIPREVTSLCGTSACKTTVVMEAVTVSRYSQCHTQDDVTIARDDSSACLLQMFAHCLESKIRTFSNRRARMTVVSHGRWSVAISMIRRQSVQSLALLGMNGSIPMLTDCTPARWYVGAHKVSSNDWTVKETPQ